MASNELHPIAAHLIEKIASLGQTDTPFILAIDGRCAAGKSSLAALLQQALACPVFHMDDFFLRPEQRTQQRLSTAGEFVDHERFLSEVLLPFSQGKSLTYRRYDCHTGTLQAPIPLPPAPLAIVEGSYACHKSLTPFYSLSVFLTIDPETQKKRLLAREGAEKTARFLSQFIPQEEAYFAAYNLPDNCDMTFSTAE